MPIQEMVIPHLLNEETDVVGLAQTGTGKTAAFGLPMLQRIDTSSTETQALILDPTRELCLQTKTDLEDYSRYVDGLRIVAVYGGASIESQIREVKRGVQVIVATPGRLQDLIRLTQEARVSVWKGRPTCAAIVPQRVKLGVS
jgi:ATP-dependent RNA helicase DeaD